MESDVRTLPIKISNYIDKLIVDTINAKIIWFCDHNQFKCNNNNTQIIIVYEYELIELEIIDKHLKTGIFNVCCKYVNDYNKLLNLIDLIMSLELDI